MGFFSSVKKFFKKVVNTVKSVVKGVLKNPGKALAIIALAWATSGASLAAEGAVAAADAVAYASAADLGAQAFAAVDAFAPIASSTLDIYTGATAAAVTTSVADYTAAAVAGTATGAATAFTAIPLSSMGASVASAGFLETALATAKEVKKAVDVIQIVNTATQQKSTVPRNAPVPPGWAIDARWSPTLGDSGAKFVYDPATGALILAQPEKPVDASVVEPAAGTMPAPLLLAAVAAAIVYFVR